MKYLNENDRHEVKHADLLTIDKSIQLLYIYIPYDRMDLKPEIRTGTSEEIIEHLKGVLEYDPEEETELEFLSSIDENSDDEVIIYKL